MVRQRIRKRGDSKSLLPEHLRGDAFKGKNGLSSDGFKLSFSNGAVILALKDIRLNEIVKVDRLELIIKDPSFPFDVTAGVRGLRHKRHTLGRLTLSVALKGLERMAENRLARSDSIKLRAVDAQAEHLSILLEQSAEPQDILIGFRLVPAIEDGALDLLLDEMCVYGPAPVNAAEAAASSVREMSGIRPEGLKIPVADPIKRALMALLPERGWRLPDYSETRLNGLELLSDRAVLDFRHLESAEEALPSPLGGGGFDETDRLKKMEKNRIAMDGDTLVSEGRFAEARSVFVRLLDRDPDDPAIAARLAMIDMTDPQSRDTALSLTRQALSRRPGCSQAVKVLAQGAALAGDREVEKAALSAIARSGDSLERLAASLRLGSVLIDSDPAGAVEALKLAVSARREDRAALFALVEAYAAAGDRDGVYGLLPRWIAAHKQVSTRCRAYSAAGGILLSRLNDPVGAVKYFERAALCDPLSPEAIRGLAESLARAGEPERAVDQFERLSRILKRKGDLRGAAGALAAIGRIWIQLDDPSLAVQRLREALDMDPDMSAERVHLARILAKIERPADAACELETVLHRTGSNFRADRWIEIAADLASLYMNELRDAETARIWVRAALTKFAFNPNTRQMLIAALDGRGGCSSLVEELKREE